jgi:DNA-directed RNA polymerase subunit RPC12/RpoP
MAQIFVSHSAKDEELVSFLSRAFASTQVKGVFEEFEAILKGPANAARIANDIRQSNAVFVLLSNTVEQLKHTRDWVGWEGGAAAITALETNKDVWVLEPVTDMDKLSIVVPHFRHYVGFDPKEPKWQAYLSQLIVSYDDSHFLKAISLGAATGGIIGEGVGALWGAGAGLLFAAMTSNTRATGLPIRCPQCSSSYSVHLDQPLMRCPVCNSRLIFPAPTAAA